MSEAKLRQQLGEAQETIRKLEEELTETNRGLLALTMELENRVDERTAELRAAQDELAQTNRELLQFATELEDRVAERTAALNAKDEELTTISQQLWQAEKLATVGELAASIAHELNNPLATVSLRVEALLERAGIHDRSRRALEVIAQETDRMANLIGNLLEFSRRGSRRVSTLDVRVEMLKTLDLIHYHLRKNNIAVVQEFTSDVPLVQADRQQLRQLFLNLFTNASDAMPQGGTLTVRVSALGGARDVPDIVPWQVVVEVADTGVGIAPGDVPKVMEAFFTTKPEGSGTGLGLPICRRIVDEHKGSLSITSDPGNGTIVRVTLPVANGTNGEYLRAGDGEDAARAIASFASP